MVVAHEVFGHGARFRELGDGGISYGFDAPIPYGSGDAFTRFNGRFPISPLADLNVSAAGIDAQHALADAITERAVARGRVHYREAWLYFESRMTAVTYIAERVSHVRGGTRYCRLSRDIREGVHCTMLAPHAQLCAAPRAARARRPAAVLLRCTAWPCLISVTEPRRAPCP